MQQFMEEALRLAREAAAAGEVPVGAVITENGVMIGRGRNRREEENDVAAHAEIEAIRDTAAKKGDWRLQGCTLYVTLEPCAMCCGAILHARLSRVVFGAFDETACAVASRASLLDGALAPAPQVVGGLRAEESERLLRDFFAERRGNEPQRLDKADENGV